jgi:hypothetical protein
MNHMFLMSGAIVPGSTYWNLGFGREKGEVARDDEASRNMNDLGQIIAWLGLGFADSFPGPPGQRLVIRQAEIVADSRAVEQPKSELRLVGPIPGEPSFKQTWEASTRQPGRSPEDLIKHVADSFPE